MIKAEVLYTVECDRCKSILDDGEFQYLVGADMAIDYAQDGDWLIKGDKHYCPKCHFMNDEDEEEVKPPIPIQIFKLENFLNLHVAKRGCNDVEDMKDCFELSGFLGGNTISETSVKMIMEIAQPFEAFIHVIPIQGAVNSRLIVDVMKDVKQCQD